MPEFRLHTKVGYTLVVEAADERDAIHEGEMTPYYDWELDADMTLTPTEDYITVFHDEEEMSMEAYAMAEMTQMCCQLRHLLADIQSVGSQMKPGTLGLGVRRLLCEGDKKFLREVVDQD